MFVDEGRPHRHPPRPDHQQGFPVNDLGRVEAGCTNNAVHGGGGRRRGEVEFDSSSSPIGFFLFGDDGGSSGSSVGRDRGHTSSVGAVQNGDKAHETTVAPAAAHDEDGVGSAVRRSDGHGEGEGGGGGMGGLASPPTRFTHNSGSNNNASRVRGRVGDARAQKIRVAGGNGETDSGENVAFEGGRR